MTDRRELGRKETSLWARGPLCIKQLLSFHLIPLFKHIFATRCDVSSPSNPPYLGHGRNARSSYSSSDIPSLFSPHRPFLSFFLSLFQPFLWRWRHRKTAMQRPQRGPNMTEGIRNGWRGGGGWNAPFSVPSSVRSFFPISERLNRKAILWSYECPILH